MKNRRIMADAEAFRAHLAQEVGAAAEAPTLACVVRSEHAAGAS